MKDQGANMKPRLRGDRKMLPRAREGAVQNCL